jgi:hypothetical protein
MSDVVEKPWRWKPGETGNPAGRPKGSRSAFSAAFIGDLTASWHQHGASVLEQVARRDPSRYLGIASTLIPKDVHRDPARLMSRIWRSSMRSGRRYRMPTIDQLMRS